MNISIKKSLLIIAGFSFILLVSLNVAFIKKKIKEYKVNRKRNYYYYVGEFAPDFEIETINGKKFKLSDYIGKKVIVLNFFTLWCEPCKKEAKELQYFVDKMKNRDVKFIAINVGDKFKAVKLFMNEKKISFSVALDRYGKIADKYRIGAYPTTVVIDLEGVIRLYERGMITNADVVLIPTVKGCLLMKDAIEKDVLEKYRKDVKDKLPKY